MVRAMLEGARVRGLQARREALSLRNLDSDTPSQPELAGAAAATVQHVPDRTEPQIRPRPASRLREVIEQRQGSQEMGHGRSLVIHGKERESGLDLDARRGEGPEPQRGREIV